MSALQPPIMERTYNLRYPRVLVSWVGGNDLEAEERRQLGPVMAAVHEADSEGKPYSRIYLLSNYPEERMKPFRAWFSKQIPSQTVISYKAISLSSPTSYAEIYPAAQNLLQEIEQDSSEKIQRVVHLSPGTPAMSAVWVLLVKTQYPSICIESWYDKESGKQNVKEVALPFEIDARFTQEATTRSDEKLSHIYNDEISQSVAFEKIITNGELDDAIIKSRKMAKRNVPVLLLGETGTGKELFARAIHQDSPRSASSFIAVNCGALPQALAESLLFGHVKGAFTGAERDHDGYFKQADGGTLFLDEVGELNLDLQVKLLRALQEKSFTPIGSSREVSSDFRVISATHQSLTHKVATGEFREDLFHRLAIGIIKIPPLRDRKEDISILANQLLEQINDELADQSTYIGKKIDGKVIELIENMAWRGNVRELRATLLRASIWSDSKILSVVEFKDSVLTMDEVQSQSLPQEIIDPIVLDEVKANVERHYITLALKRAGGNKTKAAELLGLNSQQVVSSKMKKLGIE